MIKLGKIYLNIFVFPLLVAAYITGTLNALCMSYLTVTLHELAHLFTALKLGVSVSSFVIMPFGVSLRLKDRLIDDPKKECIICAAGPVLNIFLISLALFLKSYMSFINMQFIDFFICSNASVFLINVVPIIPLDGGRVLRSILTHNYGFAKAAKISHVISQINIILIGLFSLYVLNITAYNASVMLLCAFLIFNMSSERKNDSITIMRQIIYSKEKLMKREVMDAKQIAASKEADAKCLLKSFSYNNYYLISIIDKKGNILATITESQVIDMLSKCKKNLKMKDFV